MVSAIRKLIEWSHWSYKELTEEIPLLALLMILDDLASDARDTDHEASEEEDEFGDTDEYGEADDFGAFNPMHERELGDASDIKNIANKLGLIVVDGNKGK